LEERKLNSGLSKGQKQGAKRYAQLARHEKNGNSKLAGRHPWMQLAVMRNDRYPKGKYFSGKIFKTKN
jgi:hypothetical protein